MLSLSLWLVSCGEPETSRGSSGSNILGEIDENSSNSDSVGVNGNTNSDFSDIFDAGYLFDEDEADRLSPLVLPFRSAGGDLPRFTRSSRYSRVREAISDMLDEGMRLRALNPGRRFEIEIAADDMVNAFASDQTLVFHTGLIEEADALAMAFVVCHEAAHSTRNHGARIQEEIDIGGILSKPSVRRLNQDIEDYFDNSIRNGRYFHRASLYQPLRKRWDESFGAIYTYRKRLESEADVIGGKICAELGFTPNEIVRGASAIFAKFRSGSTINIKKDGTYRLDGISERELTDALFPFGSHPTGNERDAQIKRIQDIFPERTSTRRIAEDWVDEYTSSVGGSALLGLTDFSGYGLVDEETGAVIKVDRACNHGVTPSQIIYRK